MLPSTESSPPDLKILHELESARALADPERRRLVAALLESPDSASGLARRLGESRQRLNYHLRSLEDAGILELHEERRQGNCTERLLRPTARRFLVDPGVLGAPPAGGGETTDRFSATYLVALAARTIQEVGSLMAKARREGRRLATASLDTTVELPTPRDLPAFLEELHDAVSGVVARHHDPREGSRPFRVVVGTHPRSRTTPDKTAPPEHADHETEEIEK